LFGKTVADVTNNNRCSLGIVPVLLKLQRSTKHSAASLQ